MTTGSVLAQFTITISQAVSEQVAVEWHTSDGTALAGVDYAASKGTVLFSPGETNKTVDILVYGRAVGSEDRSFFVEMMPPTNAILGASIGECIIHVDTTGSTPITQIIVPTGPKGMKGDSAYQTWLDLGNTGTEEDFINSLKPSAEEIAEEIAPILSVGNSPVISEGTETLIHPDSITVKRLARRVAYVGAAKIATVVLADGDNLITHAALSGDAVDFNSISLYPRILRGAVVISPDWSVEPGDKLLIKSAVAGDVLHVCQYDVISRNAVNNVVKGALAPVEAQSFESLRRICDMANLTLRDGSFEDGGTLTSANDVLLYKANGKTYSGVGPFPQDVSPDSNPLSAGFVDRSDDLIKVLGNMLVFYSTPSYTALVSDPSKWTGDVGTRLYICPQEKVTSGTGGAIKIFGDPYHKGGLADYRDFGAYFSADQGGYAGYHGTGTFYLNSKISGLPTGEYFTKNPDIALTFQDGQTQAWRSVYLPSDANGPTRSVTVFGKQASTTAVNRGDISIELANKMGIDRFGGFAFWGEGNFSTVFEHRVGADGTDLLRFNYYNVPKLTFKWSGVDQGILADTRIVGRQATISQGGGNLSASGFNSAYFTNTAARNISDFTDGVPGQEIALVFATSATTITHGPAIQLKGGVNFVSTPGAVLKLIRADVWREVSRSV